MLSHDLCSGDAACVPRYVALIVVRENLYEIVQEPAYEIVATDFVRALTTGCTWMSLPPPLGLDVHPYAVGYAVIAGAFVPVIGTP